jgi:phosphatidylserine/phosphatidylglycerophosphate/cardiolipin synthase-like enzyme/uncharacterized membrane protein YdjX (TVP38/TMEM64 family)
VGAHATISGERLLVPGRSCWKLVPASRLTVIHDAAATFAAMASAMSAARKSIFILGWDLDSRTVLAYGGGGAGEVRLLPFLRECLLRQPDLHVFMLLWDFSVIYAWEREADPANVWGRAHARLHFALDDGHPRGASHHQKVVVVDDDVAFIGGIDLTLHRWDTSEHRPYDHRRRDRNGLHYHPFHDVHTAVAGPAAQALGELARNRWPQRDLSAWSAEPGKVAADADAWPSELRVDAADVPVGLARTDLRSSHAPVKEVEALTLTAIAAARRWIYIENQYLTAAPIYKALAAQLMRETGPEVLVLLPEVESGWKEQSSMGILRAQAFQYLLRKDVHGKLRLLTPTVCEDGKSCSIAVHSKVLVIDDRLAKIGSANLSSRSMGLDTECDLAVEACDASTGEFVGSIRNRLLAEHLGLSELAVQQTLTAHGSLCRLVDDHPKDSSRRLVLTPRVTAAPLDLAVLDGAFVDPSEPWSANLILEHAVPVPLRRRLARRWLRPLVLIGFVIAAWFAFRSWAGDAAHLRAVVGATLIGIADRPAGKLLVVLIYAIAGALFVPVTLLATTTLAVFDMWPGVAMAWTGSLLSATLSHTVGTCLGPRIVAWLPHRVERSVRRFLERQSFWAVVFMRLVPLGNFGALNLAAGALGIRRRSFILGNMVGLLPGLFGLGVVVGRTLALLYQPSALNVGAFAGVAGAVVGATLWLRRRYKPAEPAEPTMPTTSAAPSVPTSLPLATRGSASSRE